MEEVLCIGELLVDFFTVTINETLDVATHFEKQAGGAPANVAAAITALGGQASFCGKVGRDSFGLFLEQALQARGVSTRFLVKDELPTTLAFVSRVTGGERDFSFVRGADAQLRLADIPLEQLTQRVVHFGSATALLASPFYETYMELMEHFKRRGAFISFDPNYRELLWQGKQALYKERVAACIALADFVKMSEEEYALTPFCPEEKWLAITRGALGTTIRHQSQSQLIPSIQVTAVDSTGAGDAFVGAMLKQIAEQVPVDFCQFTAYTQYSNIVGAIVCTQVGAMTALPTDAQVQQCLAKKR